MKPQIEIDLTKAIEKTMRLVTASHHLLSELMTLSLELSRIRSQVMDPIDEEE